MMDEGIYISLMVRLWTGNHAQGEGEPLAWQGEVFHIQSGKSWRFDALEPLLDCLIDFTTQDEP